jgi:predicted secreted protein
LDEAAQAFRVKAQALTKAFGFSDYRIDQLKISESGESVSPRPLMMARATSDSVEASSLNLQPGRQKVSVTVSASIQMR